MTPPARLQAAIELLDLVIASARDNGAAADVIIGRWFKTRRYAGSKDRAAVRDLVYRAIRRLGTPPPTGRAAFATLAAEDAELAALFDDSGYGPAALDGGEPVADGAPMPPLLAGLIDPAEHQALLERAPLDLRINPAKASRDELMARFPSAAPIVGLDLGLRFETPLAIERDEAWAQGLVEIQDAGSQLVAIACRAGPGHTVVDLCAGGGGKTLALAAAMGGEGRLIACDTSRDRLAPLAARAERAGVEVATRLLDTGRESEQLADLSQAADIVLVDAPCSGSGTLRRNPEARWRLTPARLDRLVELQRHVLALAVPLVRPGGTLVYAVCSLIESEGPAQIDAFLARYPGWSSEPPFAQGRVSGSGRKLTPFHDATDGFFVARLIAPC